LERKIRSEIVLERKKSMLTTIDNPFNPFVQYKEWEAYDLRMGYNTNLWLARFTTVSYELSEDDYDLEYEAGVDAVLELNPSGLHTRIYEENNINISA
jgi:hypothetical protein